MLPEVPSPHDPHVRHMRRMFLAVVTGSFLFLIPWICYLSASLPTHHEVSQWRLAWVGFDATLIAVIGITALCAWRRLQIFIPWAVATATLLCCDAWFDIVLDWNSDELTGAVLTAAFAELPLAAMLLYVARKMIRLTVIIAWHRAGRTGAPPALSRLSMIVLTDGAERERDWQREFDAWHRRQDTAPRTPDHHDRDRERDHDRDHDRDTGEPAEHDTRDDRGHNGRDSGSGEGARSPREPRDESRAPGTSAADGQWDGQRDDSRGDDQAHGSHRHDRH